MFFFRVSEESFLYAYADILLALLFLQLFVPWPLVGYFKMDKIEYFIDFVCKWETHKALSC